MALSYGEVYQEAYEEYMQTIGASYENVKIKREALIAKKKVEKVIKDKLKMVKPLHYNKYSDENLFAHLPENSPFKHIYKKKETVKKHLFRDPSEKVVVKKFASPLNRDSRRSFN